MHHIISDGWSLNIFFEEFSSLYGGTEQTGNTQIKSLPIQYPDFAIWQRNINSEQFFKNQRDYWKKELANAPKLLSLPLDHKRAATQSFSGELLPFGFDAKTTAMLKKFSMEQGATLFITLLASFASLLARLSGEDDIVIGSPTANRQQSELEGLIGFFVNMISIRIQKDPEVTFSELLKEVKSKVLSAQDHQALPFEEVIDLVHQGRSKSHTPIFQAVFSWQVGQEGKLHLPGVAIQSIEIPRATSKFDISAALEMKGDVIAGHIEYSTALFERSTLTRWMEYWHCIIDAILIDPGQRINAIDILPAAEHQRVVEQFNATAQPYELERTVMDLVEAQVRQQPQAMAVSFEDQALSYAELDAQANQLAHHLVGLGVRPDARVALCLQRSPAMVIAMLAVVKAGGAYVPIDPEYPAERIGYMLQDCGALAVLTDAASLAGVQALIGQDEQDEQDTRTVIVNLDAEQALWATQPATAPDRAGMQLKPSHLAYVIYTSGSTGMPKGVMVEHRGLSNLVNWHGLQLGLGAGDRTALMAGLSFDAFAWESWATLANGAQAMLPPAASRGDAAALLNWWRAQPLTHSFLVTPLAELAWAQRKLPPTLKTLLIGGDRLRQWPTELPEGLTVINAYGPTEATVVASAGALDPHSPRIHIGRPIANTRIYILDAHGHPVPMGAAGELCIAGVQVARGYLNRPELSAERFVRDPFVSTEDTSPAEPADHARMYRTGDLARWLSDGSIDYLGRIDHQVKIRGFRIEPGEIEARLCAHAGVAEAVVIPQQDAGQGARLVAYVVPQDGASLDTAELRQWIAASLPEHMVPAAFVVLDAMPVTPNGKLDRKALPVPGDSDFQTHQYEAPLGPVETTIAQIWQDILGMERVGRHDNFFELGGHSLLAVKMMDRLRSSGYQARLSDIYRYARVDEIALAINASQRKKEYEFDVLRAGGEGESNLFILPDGQGMTSYAYGLAPHILNSMTLALVPWPELGSFRSMEELASWLCGQIRQVQPQGPYHLMSYSGGGALCQAVAYQLSQQGESVPFLGMIDCFAPPLDFNIVNETLSSLKNEELGLGISLDETINYYRLFNAYQPSKSNLSASFYLADQLPPTTSTIHAYAKRHKLNGDVLGWRDLFSESTDVKSLAYDHYAMCREPGGLALLGKMISEALVPKVEL